MSPSPASTLAWLARQLFGQALAMRLGLGHSDDSRPGCGLCGAPALLRTTNGYRCAACGRPKQP